MEILAQKDGAGKSCQRLLDSIDKIIASHGRENAELARDLTLLRQELCSAIQQGRRRDLAATAMKVAAWVKFFYDLWDPD